MASLVLWLSACGFGWSYDFKLPGGKVVLLGDTHRKNPLAIFQTNPNGHIPLLFGRIAKERNLRAVFLAGDIVQVGALDAPLAGLSGWAAFREDAAPLIKRRIPIFPVLGNHDYRGPKARALGNFFDHFPHLKGRRFYSVKVGDTLYVMLDSNLRKLGNEMRERQLAWLNRTLGAAQQDRAVRHVAAIFHHPPYYGAVRGVELESPSIVREFIQPLSRYSKARLVANGHVHQYEHRVKNGVHFVVAGGGSTPHFPNWMRPRQFLSQGVERRARLFDFHYLRISPEKVTSPLGIPRLSKSLAVEMVRWGKGLWPVAERFLLRRV